ncbi:MAG: transcriptional regulator [Candidatus Parabeggiatoa sp. nov. 3]|nr:MAG: transcriptional regulator [Gammaproteobacteria bacterium]RKZ67518.1 MAG: transcriptional regulator [Gammaproteobacteria bacterium]RKZ88469.1 MAG: transcriptional regulator [Gammaproteobacteria bacterium]
MTLKDALKKGEDSSRQFKENVNSIDKLTVEISAFANTNGGQIYIGVDDNSLITGLSGDEIKRLNQWISSATSQKIEPPIFVQTEIVLSDDKKIMIITVPSGTNKPYSVNKSEFWVKNGADKRRASRDELFRLMQSASRLSADEMETDVEIEAFDFFYFSEFYQMVYGETLDHTNISKSQLLKNFKLLKDKHLTLAGLLLFGKQVELMKPQFGIKATYYLNDDEFLDKEDISGKLPEQQKKGVDFILRHLKRRPTQNDFNAPGELEIPLPAIKEAVANALVHRDYFINSAIFIQIFADRVEIGSAGVLPNTLTIENIKLGIHIERNPIILSFMAKFSETGYTGRGSGIPRMLRICQEKNVPLELINDLERNQFKVIFYRALGSLNGTDSINK